MAADERERRREPAARRGCSLRRTPDPCALVIFGASGDLTHKKLMPALYALMLRRLLPARFAIVGVARSEGDDDSFRADMEQAVQKHARDEFRQDVWDELAAAMHYVSDGLRRRRSGEDELARALSRLDEEHELGGNRVYYLAVPPSAFPTIVEALGKRRTAHRLDAPDRREAVRPRPRVGARAERDAARAHFDEKEIFRIDHYLGKETVQNMLALRFANGIFEPIWNRQFIDHVQITVAESIGIEGRAGYYERGGRDPRHLPEPPAAAARAHGDGAADRLHRRVGAQREGEGAEVAAHARAEVGRARPVRARLRRGRGGARLPRGAGRRAGLDDGDVRRGEAVRRQLALGRHAVLRAHGQAARAARDDDRDPVQARAASAVRGDGVRRACARTSCSCTCSRTRACRSRSARRCRARE